MTKKNPKLWNTIKNSGLSMDLWVIRQKPSSNIGRRKAGTKANLQERKTAVYSNHLWKELRNSYR